MTCLYKMKHLFIIGVITVLLAGLSNAGEVNQPAEKVQYAETKSLSSDSIITAFTFLLAALTVMATLFGIFIGYIAYKSGKEYEKEVTKAEDAARRAEEAAKNADILVRQIGQKGEETISGMQRSFKDTIKNMKVRFEPEEGEPTGADKKLKEFFEKLRVKDDADDYKGIADIVEGAIAFAEENAELWYVELWYVWARALAIQSKYQDALIKINTTIQKDSKHGRAYFFRGMLRLVWARREQRQPHMSEIIKDLKKSIELGYEVEKDPKESLSNYLTDVEYKDVFDRTKEEDGFGKE